MYTSALQLFSRADKKKKNPWTIPEDKLLILCCSLLTCETRLVVGSTHKVMIKNLPANAGDVRNLGSIPLWEDPLEEEMAHHSSILARRIPWTEKPGSLQPVGLKKVRHDWASEHWAASAWWGLNKSKHGRSLARGLAVSVLVRRPQDQSEAASTSDHELVSGEWSMWRDWLPGHT